MLVLRKHLESSSVPAQSLLKPKSFRPHRIRHPRSPFQRTSYTQQPRRRHPTSIFCWKRLSDSILQISWIESLLRQLVRLEPLQRYKVPWWSHSLRRHANVDWLDLLIFPYDPYFLRVLITRDGWWTAVRFAQVLIIHINSHISMLNWPFNHQIISNSPDKNLCRWNCPLYSFIRWFKETLRSFHFLALFDDQWVIHRQIS